MTREEAIRILDPETTAEALAEIEYYAGFSGEKAAIHAVSDACEIAVDAMRRLAVLEKNNPLTLEELREMVTQWVWVVVNYEHNGVRIQTDGWGLVATPAVVAYLDQFLPTDFYGRKFVAYRRKPAETEEEKHENY